MPIAIAALTVILDAICIIHIMKTGRPYWWGFIILSFPVMGCIVYYFIEIFPDTREADSAKKLAHKLGKQMSTDKVFTHRIQEAEICGSVENKLALARECMGRGLYDDAVRLYRSCMTGLYADDPNLLLGLAQALIEKQEYAEASQKLAQLQIKDPAFKPNDSALLRARTLEGLGDTDGALREYAALLPVYVGLEARYRHGLLLKKLDRIAEARKSLEEMQTHAGKHRLSHSEEVAWLDRARKELGR